MKDAAFMSIVPRQEDAKTKIVYMGERLKRNKMRMSIDEAIKHLHTYSSTLGSGQTPQDQHEEAKRVAIATMRKYQKIEKIVFGDFEKGYQYAETVHRIRKVLESEEQ